MMKRITSLLLAVLLAMDGASSPQEWPDGPLTENAGASSDSLVMILRQYRPDLDYSAYAARLRQVVQDGKVRSASNREKLALALFATGAGDAEFVSQTMADAIGG